mgnify:CR=1 FL=1
MKTKVFMSVKEAANLLDITPQGVHLLVKKGALTVASGSTRAPRLLRAEVEAVSEERTAYELPSPLSLEKLAASSAVRLRAERDRRTEERAEELHKAQLHDLVLQAQERAERTLDLTEPIMPAKSDAAEALLILGAMVAAALVTRPAVQGFLRKALQKQ